MTPRTKSRGLLVAIEGVDGAGKSTLQRTLARRLRAEGLTVGLWKEPTDPRLGRRAQVAGTDRPWISALLFTLDRIRARPRLEALRAKSAVVLCDRSFYSTLAYQGSALPRDERPLLERIQRRAAMEPDLVLWLHLPPVEALRRVKGRGKATAPLERRRTLARVDRAYRVFARSRGWTGLDARDALADNVTDGVRAIRSRLGPRRSPRRT